MHAPASVRSWLENPLARTSRLPCFLHPTPKASHVRVESRSVPDGLRRLEGGAVAGLDGRTTGRTINREGVLLTRVTNSGGREEGAGGYDHAVFRAARHTKTLNLSLQVLTTTKMPQTPGEMTRRDLQRGHFKNLTSRRKLVHSVASFMQF